LYGPEYPDINQQLFEPERKSRAPLAVADSRTARNAGVVKAATNGSTRKGLALTCLSTVLRAKAAAQGAEATRNPFWDSFLLGIGVKAPVLGRLGKKRSSPQMRGEGADHLMNQPRMN